MPNVDDKLLTVTTAIAAALVAKHGLPGHGFSARDEDARLALRARALAEEIIKACALGSYRE